MKSYLTKTNLLHRILPTLLFTLAAILFFLLFASYTRPAVSRILLAPSLIDTNGWELYTYGADGTVLPLTQEEYLSSGGITLYLTRTLPASYEEAGYTTLILDQMASYAVFLDNKLIYSSAPEYTGEPDSIRFPAFTVNPMQGESRMVSLPRGYGGKQLTIAYKKQYPSPSFPSIFLSSTNAETEDIATLLSRQLIPGIFLGVLSFILLTLFLLGLIQKQIRLSFLLLPVASLCETLLLLSDLNLHFPGKTFLNSPLIGFLQPLFAHLPLLFFLTQMKKCRRIFAPFALLSFAATLISPLLNLFGVYNTPVWFWVPFQAVLPLFLICSVVEARSGNEIFGFMLKCMLPFFAVLAVALLFPGGGNNFLRNYMRILLVPGWLMRPNELIFWSGTLLLLAGLAVSARSLLRSYAGLRTEREVLLLTNRLARENLNAIQENSRQLAEARHNFSHHLTVLKELARADKREELEQYLEHLTEETDQILPLTLTSHPAVNAVMTNALARAGQNGIRMDYNILLPGELPISDIDLCNYLMNLLDNAINAQKDVAANKKWISVTMHIRGNYLFIEASNALAHKVSIDETSGLCISENKDGHGYGMKTMQSIATRYHSILSIETSADSILVRTALLMPRS